MNVIDLDGHYSSWHLTGHIAKGRIKDKSSYHLLARNLLCEMFPTLQILEEVPISVRKSETLYLDFYMPLVKKAIEVHGEQHYRFVPFYHSNKINFLKSQKRDNDKKEWCERNGISHVVLPYNKSILEWRSEILS